MNDRPPPHPSARGSSADAAWASGFLSALPTKAQEELRSTALPMAIPPGHTVYRAFDQPRFVLLVSGLARVVASSAEGRKATIRYARSGDVVGAVAVVTDRQAVSVEAVTELDVLFLNVDRLRRFARSEPEVGWALAQLVGSVATEVIDMMSATVFGSVRRRLARHLLDLAIQQSGELVVIQDQQEIADAIGSVREVVGRALRELRERGLVSRTEWGLRVDDPNGLYIVSTLG